MSKKIRRKKTAKGRRKKNNPHKKPILSVTTEKAIPSKIKISEAILILSENLRKQYGGSHRVQAILSITIIAWNISLFPEEEQENVRKMLTDSFQKAIEGEDTVVLLNCVDTLIERKKVLFPNVNEYIVNYDLSFSGDEIRLAVESSPIDGKIQRRTENDTL